MKSHLLEVHVVYNADRCLDAIFFLQKICVVHFKVLINFFSHYCCSYKRNGFLFFSFEKLLESIEVETFKFFGRKNELSLNSERVFP